MKKKKMMNKQKFSIATAVLTLLAHIIVLVFVLMSYKYYGLEIKTFVSLIGVIILLLIIVDILFFIGFNYRDHKIKIVVFAISAFLFLSGCAGTFVVRKVNKTVNKITSNDGVEQYEEIGVNFTTYDNPSIKEITDLEGKRVGIVVSNGNSATSVGQEKLEKEKIEVDYVEFTTLNDLILGLLNGDVDSAILQSGYKSILKTNEAYEEYIEKVTDIYTFTENIKVGENASAHKDLSVEPFNILLIGFAPEESGGGLADSIILASVNPKSMTVTLTSVPRDSYVPIACYPGQSKDKITHSRAYGRECLMDTVGNIFDVDVDLYMEINFQGLADVVDAVGGIWIDSPVEFVGQTPSSRRGEFTVWVGKGGQMANGDQALAFARERHAMPNGDLDRAIHQQEVIAQIAEKLINLRDVNKALKVLDVAGDNFSTNLSLNQLTSIFSYIISAPNNGGITKMQTIDIQSMRLSGYGSRGYHMGMQLPIYVYPLYKGSIKQCSNQIADTIGLNTNIKQDDYFKFFAEYPYERGPLYSEYFDEPQIHEELPGFVLNFVSAHSTLDEVKEWANKYGVNLNIKYVKEGDPRYIEGAEGIVVDMSEKYGLLVSNIANNTLTVWVCGEIDPALRIPYFIDSPISVAKKWAKENEYKLNINIVKESDPNFVSEKAGLIFEQSIKAGEDKTKFTEITISAYELPKKKVDISGFIVNKSTKDDILAWANANSIPMENVVINEVKSNDVQTGTLIEEPVWSNPDDSAGGPFADSVFTFTIAKKAENVEPEEPLVPDHGGEESGGEEQENVENGEGPDDGKIPENDQPSEPKE